MCAALVERFAAPGRQRPMIWLDHFAYSGRLLAAGAIPWLDAREFFAYYRKTHSLLKPEVAMLPVEGFFDAWLERHPDLGAAMAGRPQPAAALRTLLADDGARTLLREIVEAVRGTFTSTPLVIAIPSPRRWLVWAHSKANGLAELMAIEASGDNVESAAMHVAGFLRTFAEAGVDGLLIEETPGHGPASAEEVRWYQPVINVAKHYRWDVGLKSTDSSFVPGADLGFDFNITDAEVAGGLKGVILGDAFWAGEEAPALPRTCFYFARVPEHAVPEHVLERLATLA